MSQVPPPFGGDEGAVTASTGEEGFLTEINAAGHALLGDEPAAVGGTDAGPSPYDLLSAALASCTSMTLQLYARRKEFPLIRVTVSVRHTRIHTRDCAECETKEGWIDEFQRQIALEGDLDDDARQRLLAIADRCPVHQTLTKEVRILTSLVN